MGRWYSHGGDLRGGHRTQIAYAAAWYRCCCCCCCCTVWKVDWIKIVRWDRSREKTTKSSENGTVTCSSSGNTYFRWNSLLRAIYWMVEEWFGRTVFFHGGRVCSWTSNWSWPLNVGGSDCIMDVRVADVDAKFYRSKDNESCNIGTFLRSRYLRMVSAAKKPVLRPSPSLTVLSSSFATRLLHTSPSHVESQPSLRRTSPCVSIPRVILSPLSVALLLLPWTRFFITLHNIIQAYHASTTN